MCSVTKELREMKVRPVSSSFEHLDEVTEVLSFIQDILNENDTAVISSENRVKILRAITELNKTKKRKRKKLKNI